MLSCPRPGSAMKNLVHKTHSKPCNGSLSKARAKRALLFRFEPHNIVVCCIEKSHPDQLHIMSPLAISAREWGLEYVSNTMTNPDPHTLMTVVYYDFH
jgi:hypothetical protein